MATTKQELSRFRNLTYGNLVHQKDILNNMMLNLPNNCKSLTPDERVKIMQIKTAYNDLLSCWKRNSEKLVSNVNVNF